RRPRRDMRILIATDRAVAVGFNVPVAELLTARDLARHDHLHTLGPDLLSDTFDAADAIARMRDHPQDPIAELLLDQRVVAGIGNVFKSEILFLAKVYPFTLASHVTDAQIGEMIAIARKVMAASVKAGQRMTRSSLNPSERLWVYGRGGKPCH